MRNILKLTFVLYNTARGYYELVPHRLGAAVHQTDIDVNGMVESLERAQASRLAHLDSLQHRLSSCQQDRGETRDVCRSYVRLWGLFHVPRGLTAGVC